MVTTHSRFHANSCLHTAQHRSKESASNQQCASSNARWLAGPRKQLPARSPTQEQTISGVPAATAGGWRVAGGSMQTAACAQPNIVLTQDQADSNVPRATAAGWWTAAASAASGALAAVSGCDVATAATAKHAPQNAQQRKEGSTLPLRWQLFTAG